MTVDMETSVENVYATGAMGTNRRSGTPSSPPVTGPPPHSTSSRRRKAKTTTTSTFRPTPRGVRWDAARSDSHKNPLCPETLLETPAWARW